MTTPADTLHPLTATRDQFEAWMEARGHRAFHGRQLHAWIHRRAVTDYAQMTDLSRELREELERELPIPMPRVVETAAGEGEDSAIKFLFELEDGERVETVLIPAEDRNTLCLSSQVGCAFACTFCATGLLGLKRNMTAAEILGTYFAARQYAADRITNVVFMGMGEPLANLEQVLDSWRLLTDPDGIGMSRRKVTISTVGLPPKIRKMAEIENPPKLVFSIGSPHEEIRRRIMPVSGRFSLAENRAALADYAERTRHRITIALLVAQGLNDSPEDIRALHNWIGDLPAKVNLLRYNEAAGNFRRVSEETMDRLADQLVGMGRTVILRRSRGRDVSAACGQLAARQLNPAAVDVDFSGRE